MRTPPRRTIQARFQLNFQILDIVLRLPNLGLILQI